MPKNSHRLRLLVAAMIPAMLGSITMTAPAHAVATDDAPRASAKATTDIAPAPARAGRKTLGDQVLCPVDELSVPESAGTGVVTERLHYGETLTVEPLSDQIWAGVWFTGSNGPEGWTNTSAPSFYPLPGVPQYSLIARLGNGPHQYVGAATRSFTNLKPNYVQRVRFKVNDDVPGNGAGAFKVVLRYPCH